MTTRGKKNSAANVPAEIENQALILGGDVIDFDADAGAGFEEADKDSFAIPFLRVLQKGSPQVDEESPAYIPGAKPGMLMNSVTGELFDGKPQVDDDGKVVGGGVLLIPCAFQRRFLRWGPRGGDGAGFKGEIKPEDAAALRDSGAVVDHEGKLLFPVPETGELNAKKCDRLQDTRNHFGILLTPDGGHSQVLLSLASTQIKKSKALMSLLNGRKVKNSKGAMITPPMYANVVRMTTIAEQNDQGTWYGVTFELVGTLQNQALYTEAKAFHDAVGSSAVSVKYVDEEAGGGPSSGEF